MLLPHLARLAVWFFTNTTYPSPKYIYHTIRLKKPRCCSYYRPYNTSKIPVKSKCLIISSLRQKQYCPVPCLLGFGRLTFVRMTLIRRYQRKFLLINCAFNFHKRLLMLGLSLWMNVAHKTIIIKVEKRRKPHLTFIRLAKKCESTFFQ